MMKRSIAVLYSGFTMKYKMGTGMWDEDHVNDYNASTYMSARTTMGWYHDMERYRTLNNLKQRKATQSHNNNNGLHHSGKDAFERELERKGVPVSKYPLTTTTGASRVAEMVLLRRAELEKQSSELLKADRAKRRIPSPTEWYNEEKGPLNPNFLAVMQKNYDECITELPSLPIRPHQKRV